MHQERLPNRLELELYEIMNITEDPQTGSMHGVSDRREEGP